MTRLARTSSAAKQTHVTTEAQCACARVCVCACACVRVCYSTQQYIYRVYKLFQHIIVLHMEVHM